MTAKLGATLADAIGATLRRLAGEYRVNQSVITEAALMHFFQLPASERDHLIKAMSASKKAYTRGRWRATFWDGVFDEFWFPQELRGGRRGNYTPRHCQSRR